MSEIEAEIIQLAERLGQAMSDSRRTKTFKTLRGEVLADKDTQALLASYQGHLNSLSEKERNKQPIEVEDKRKLADFQEKIYRNDRLKQLMAAQADYMEMIQQVNATIGKHLITPDEVAAEQRG